MIERIQKRTERENLDRPLGLRDLAYDITAFGYRHIIIVTRFMDQAIAICNHVKKVGWLHPTQFVRPKALDDVSDHMIKFSTSPGLVAFCNIDMTSEASHKQSLAALSIDYDGLVCWYEFDLDS